MRTRLAASMVTAALCTVVTTGAVLAQSPSGANAPIAMGISINGIEDSCSAVYYDPPPGVEDFLGTAAVGSATVIVRENPHGATALCQTHDHENDAEVGYTDECWLHMPDGDWSQGRGRVIATDLLWTDAEGRPTSRVTITCSFDRDNFHLAN